MMLATEIVRLSRAQSRQLSGHERTHFKSSEEPQAPQHGRVLQPGRARYASSPWQIQITGWKNILCRTYERIGEDRLLAVAAGVVFYGLLALFPAVTALVSLWSVRQSHNHQ
jgi:membrane protein